MTTTSQALKYNVLKETSKMIKLISMVVDIGLMPGMLWLNWLVFDILGLACFSLFLDSVVTDLYCSIRHKSFNEFDKGTIVFFDFYIYYLLYFFTFYILNIAMVDYNT